MTEFNIAPATALLIDIDAMELRERKPEILDVFDLEPDYAVIAARVLEDCLLLWADSQAFHLRVAAWRQVARGFAERDA